MGILDQVKIQLEEKWLFFFFAWLKINFYLKQKKCFLLNFNHHHHWLINLINHSKQTIMLNNNNKSYTIRILSSHFIIIIIIIYGINVSIRYIQKKKKKEKKKLLHFSMNPKLNRVHFIYDIANN